MIDAKTATEAEQTLEPESAGAIGPVAPIRLQLE